MNFLDAEITFPSYVPMTAWFEHGPFAMWLVRKMKPRRIVELGSHFGYSYFAMCEAVRDAGLPTECYAVDTWIGEEHAGYYDESVYESVVAENRKYSSFSRLLRKTFAEALDDIEDGSVDLLHVDGRHFYEDVKEDFESWIPKLSSSAVVLFHDTEVRERNFGVHRYWAEIRDNRPSLNFRHEHGLGVLFWGEEIPDGLRDFLDLAMDPRKNELILTTFAALGGKKTAQRARGELEMQLKQISEQKDQEAFNFRARQVELLAKQTELVTSLHERNLELADLRRQASDLNAQVAETERVLNARVTETTRVLNARVAENENLRHERNLFAEQANKLRYDLAAARQKPWKSLKRKHLTNILYFLAERETLFSERRRRKFMKSARKRDPKRSLRGLIQPIGVPQQELGSASVLARHQQPGVDLSGNAPKPMQRNAATTVMVVTHEASRTGAPILALNLIRELGKRYNVVAVSLGGGDLAPDFTNNSVEFLVLDRRTMLPERMVEKVTDLLGRYDISMAFVNSVESRFVLPALQAAGVPSVTLLHEFAAYTRPKSAFPDVFSTTDQVVFSTGITLENALAQPGVERPLNVHVLPQGKCVARLEDKEPDEEERRWLDSVLRPNGIEDNEFLVIGAGTIETRKGIDLFIETATRIISGPGGGHFRFVWIGHGYDPEKDVIRSVYLADQIGRAGIQSQLQIVRATSEIEYAYRCADLMLLSSRLDPLPNVAIDMLLAGKPVMCFDRTTGIAEFLEAAGLGEDCVASYLDTTEMAGKIRTLADNPSRLAEVAERGTARARETFDFEGYTRRLEEIIKVGGRKADRIEADLASIRNSGAFRSDFNRPTWNLTTDEDQTIQNYLETNRSGPHLRKPAPGFNQLIFAEENGWGRAKDPFAEFLETGRPEGRWLAEVIDETGPIENNALESSRVALHVHAFFSEEFRDILARLMSNRIRPSLFVSFPESRIDDIREALAVYDGPVAALETVPNRGRDIGPFLTLFGRDLVADFDIVGHLHTKRSKDIEHRETVENWVDFLMENTLGGPKGGAMLDRIVTAMASSPDLGIVYPDDPNLIGWAENKSHAEMIAAKMGIHSLPEHINYPMGTMFWARADLIRRFVDLNLDWNDYPAEPLPYDGSLLHALERLFGVVPAQAGLRTAVTNIHGLTR